MRELGRAWEDGDAAALRRLLAPDVTAALDGGDRSCEAGRTAAGVPAVLTLLLSARARHPELEVQVDDVNGGVGLILRRGHSVLGVVAARRQDGAITQLWVVLNPDKLRSWRSEGDGTSGPRDEKGGR